MSAKDVHSLVVQCLDDLSIFRYLRQRRFLAKATIVDGPRLAQIIPTYLLDTVIKLIGVPIRVIDIAVPVAARHVTAHTLDRDITLLKVMKRIDHFFEAANLPGDLVNGHFRAKFAIRPEVHDSFVEQHKRVMIGTVAHEKAAGVHERFYLLWHTRYLGKIELVGDFEAQEGVVEVQPFCHLQRVKAKMAQPPHLERARQENPADIVLL